MKGCTWKCAAWALGAAALGLGLWGAFMFVELGTGKPNLDALRVPLMASLAKRLRPSVALGRALMAIFHNEHTNGDPTRDIGVLGSGGNTDPLTPGDTDYSKTPGGPSIGPGQVYWASAKKLVAAGKLGGPWVDAITSRENYFAFGSDPANLYALVDGAVVVFLDKLDGDPPVTEGAGAGGDIPTAIEFYNDGGSGKGGQYQANALAFENASYTAVSDGGES